MRPATWVAIALLSAAPACGGPRSAGPAPERRPTSAATFPAESASSPDAGRAEVSDTAADAGAASDGFDGGSLEDPYAESTPKPEPPCPEDMVLVDTTFCPEVQRICLKKGYAKANKIWICNLFSERAGTKCLGNERRQRFCIDRFEYPNKQGAHPPVMVDYYDAQSTCQKLGKRLCWESEWVAACEGPAKMPFPYGWRRDATKCNIDNPWRIPDLQKVYSKDPVEQDKMLRFLDQSKPSGAMPECKSGYGVYDLTGNVDEWVMAEERKGKGRFAALKGGAWGHVRNACRPKTTSHGPDFTYYFVSFRCCADAKGAEGTAMWVPPAIPAETKQGKANAGWVPR